MRASVKQVASGLVFPEGPVWHPDGFLLFSDVHGGTIEKLVGDGRTETWWKTGKHTNGLIMSPDKKKILACCYSERELLEIDAWDKSYRVLAAECCGRPFLNVNDVAVGEDGVIYFSDPTWDSTSGLIQGVYAVFPDGRVKLAAEVPYQPNGLVISPDQQRLYVARSGAHDILCFHKERGGEISGGMVWTKLFHGAEPDGMTIDSRGNLYVALAGTGQLAVIDSKGRCLEVFDICGRMATNCEFHGDDEHLLYVTGGGRRGSREGGVWLVEFSEIP
jgi:gluconolactonase